MGVRPYSREGPLLPRNAKAHQNFFWKILEIFSGAMALLIAPEKSEVKWHNFAAKSLPL
jgi:hypothetical protein